MAVGIDKDFKALASNAPPVVKSLNNRLANREQYSPFAPQAIKEIVDALEKTITDFYDKIQPQGKQADGFSIEKFGQSFVETNNSIIAAEEKYKESSKQDFEKDKKFDYFIKMERALLLYWEARAIKQSIKFSAERFDKSISLALELYYEMADKNYYRHDSILEYRLATCLLLWDQFDLALQKYKKANAVLAEDKTLPHDNEYRAIIPRAYGFMLWCQYDEICNKAGNIKKSPLRKQASEIVAEAYKTTYAAYKAIKLRNIAIFEKEPKEETSYVNNILYYLIEHVTIGSRECSLRELKPNMTDIKAAYELLKTSLRNLADLDTCACVAEFLDNPEAQELATRLEQGLGEKEKTDSYSERQLSRMRQTATRIRGGDHGHT